MLNSPKGLRAWVAGASLIISALLTSPCVASTAAVIFIFGPPTTQHLLAPAPGQPGTIDSIPLTLNPNGQTGNGGQLQSLGIAGANAADFAIVPGGTCVPGTTVLFPNSTTTGTSCTVNVRYTPSSPAVESAFLTASCTTVGLVGGFSIVCNNTIGSVASLVGSLFQAVPALSPSWLTALAVALFALGSFASLRRGDTGRR